jgi:hypothetical protein
MSLARLKARRATASIVRFAWSDYLMAMEVHPTVQGMTQVHVLYYLPDGGERYERYMVDLNRGYASRTQSEWGCHASTIFQEQTQGLEVR